jgi:hypothetical protein
MELAEVWPQGLSIASHHPKITLQSLIYQFQFADSVGGESQKLKGWTWGFQATKHLGWLKKTWANSTTAWTWLGS